MGCPGHASNTCIVLYSIKTASNFVLNTELFIGVFCQLIFAMKGAGDQVPEELGLRNRVCCGNISLFPRYNAGIEDWFSTEVIIAFNMLR